jgi:hypothetical protein
MFGMFNAFGRFACLLFKWACSVFERFFSKMVFFGGKLKECVLFGLFFRLLFSFEWFWSPNG